MINLNKREINQRMNKSILFKILLISSCSLITEVGAKNLSEKDVTANQTLLNVDSGTLAQMNLDGDKDAILDKHDQCPNTPDGNDVDRYGCTKYTIIKAKKIEATIEPKIEEIGTISLLVNFENDKYNVDKKYFSEISRVADFLNRYLTTSIIIEGHTSSQGSSKHNKELSQNRANAIMNVLITKFSIDRQRLSAIGYGEDKLIDLEDTPKAHLTNRRVVGVVSTAK